MRIPENNNYSNVKLNIILDFYKNHFELKFKNYFNEIKNQIKEEIKDFISDSNNIYDINIIEIKQYSDKINKIINYVWDYSAFNQNFLGYYYFYQSIFNKQLIEMNSKSGCTPIIFKSKQNFGNDLRTNNIRNIYLNDKINNSIFQENDNTQYLKKNQYINEENILNINKAKTEKPLFDKNFKINLTKRFSSEFSK